MSCSSDNVRHLLLEVQATDQISCTNCAKEFPGTVSLTLRSDSDIQRVSRILG